MNILKFHGIPHNFAIACRKFTYSIFIYEFQSLLKIHKTINYNFVIYKHLKN